MVWVKVRLRLKLRVRVRVKVGKAFGNIIPLRPAPPHIHEGSD